MEFQQDREAITRALLRERGSRETSSAEGETWVLCRCPFHDDNHRFASWQPQTGVFYCHAEDRTFPVLELLKHFQIPTSTPRHSNGGVQPLQRLRSRHRQRIAAANGGVQDEAAPAPELTTVITYEYRHPDGSLSHRKIRQDFSDGSKKVYQEGPNGESSLPATVWPLYGDQALVAGGAVLVVEGEKCVDRVQQVDDSFSGLPIRAVTAGSANDLRRHVRTLAARVGELSPAQLLIWPDNDDEGMKPVQELARAFRAQGLQFKIVKPADYGLQLKGDVADFLEQGGSLSQVFADHFTSQSTLAIDQLVDKLLVTSDEMVLFPGRQPKRVQTQSCQALWLEEYGQLPSSRQCEEFRARLLLKSAQDPATLGWRLHASDSGFWWRQSALGRCYEVSARGIELSDDPQGLVLLVPGERPLYSTEVDLGGSRAHLEQVAELFQLTETELAMCEGWLVSAFCGLQTPILFMRGGAGTGKTTLARFLLSVVEPVCPAIEASRSRSSDARQLLLTLKRAPGMVLDNVSSIDSETEDLLSQLVTGYTRAHRPLYEERVEFLSMRRAVIITSTNYDVYKGDLASRMVVVQPRLQGGWRSDAEMHRILEPLCQGVRGYAMQAAVAYYRHPASDHSQPFRIGSLGQVFEALGHDVEALARAESEHRAEVIGLNDAWLEAIVDLWEEEASEVFLMTGAEVLQHMQAYGIPDLPPVKSPKLARWLGEKQMIFRDHGFQVEQTRSADWRGYRFSKVNR